MKTKTPRKTHGSPTLKLVKFIEILAFQKFRSFFSP